MNGVFVQALVKKEPARWQYPNVITEIPADDEWPDSAGNLKEIEPSGSGQDEALSVDIEQQREVFADCAVAIQAGVVPIAREAVRPGRRIEVAVPGDKTGIRIMSIIEWRLRQLAQIHLSLKLAKPIPVLLMVSYQTRCEISAILNRLHDTPCDDSGPVDLLESRIKVFLLQQPLVRWAASPDRSRPLRQAGHLDLLRLAVHWHRTYPLDPAPRYLMSFPHNNLGTVLDPAELTANLSKFRDRKCMAAVELFHQPTHDHPRYSYQFAEYLWKKDYRPPDPIVTKIAQAIKISEKALNSFKASGHTWYFDLHAFADKPELIPNFWIKSAEPHKVPRQDLELLTYQPGCSVLGLDYPAGTDDNALKHPRFTVAHHEGEVQCRWVRETIEAQEPVPFVGATERKREGINGEDLRDRLLLRAIPYVNQNVWGGMLLAGMKGRDEKKIGETWEVSTHWTGPAAVEHNGQKEPMSLVLDDYPLMLKYLDCEDNLSVQVHPPKRAIDALNLANSIGTGAGSDQEKEESFFVIRVSDRPENLLLGFNLKRTEAIAHHLRPALYRNAVRRSDGNASENEEWLEVTKQLQKAYKSFLEERASKAQSEKEAEALLGLAQVVTNGDWSKDNDQRCLDLRGALSFHWNHAKHPAEKKDLGNLLAGVGFIHMLRLLRETLMKGSTDAWHETARAWFDASRSNGPLLSFFHRIKLETSQWMRVPPGLVHAWQGGGNLVMETSNRSDQTYRLFDYGRELIDDPTRPLHYKEAMYALTPEAFLKDGAHQRLTKGDFHRDLDLEMLKGADACAQGLPIRFERKRCGWAFAMNTDNAMEVTAITDPASADHPAHGQRSGERGQSDGRQAECLSVPALSTVLFQAKTTLYVTPREPNDRVLVLYARERDDFKKTLLISLGATKIEVALKTQGVTPPTRYLAAAQEQIAEQIATASSKLEGSLVLAGQLLKQLLEEHLVDRDRYGTLTKVGVSWPGPKFDNRLLSSFLGNMKYDDVKERIWKTLGGLDMPWASGAAWLNPEQIDIRPDAEVIAMAEERHPQGALTGSDSNAPAMVLNIGSGICAGFNAAAKVDGVEQRKKSPERALAGAIGRWLRIDVVTGRVTPCWEKVLVGQASTPQPLETVDDFLDDKGSGPRLSASLSTIALALRLLRQLAHAEVIRHPGPEEARASKKLLRCMMMPPVSEDFLFSKPVSGHNKPLFEVLTTEPYATAHACIKKLRHQVNRFELFNYVSQAGFRRDGDNGGHLDSRCVIRDFVIEVAGDLAATLSAIEQCAPSIGLDPGTTRYCVLTGSIGRDFGRDEDDLLLRTLSDLLPKPHTVVRSNLAAVAEAEIEAFE